MFDEIQTLEGETIEDKCHEFAAVLGLNKPVPAAVLEAALADENYARNLLASRRAPAFLQRLLDRPPAVHSSQPAQDYHEHSNGELILKASTALLEWGKTGFSVVDDATLERRRSACAVCPHLGEATKKLARKLALGKKGDQKICRLCGCNVSRKTRLPSESCPDKHPEREGMTRWSEPIREGR